MEIFFDRSFFAVLVSLSLLAFALRFPPPPRLVAPLLALLTGGLFYQGACWLWQLPIDPESHRWVVLLFYTGNIIWGPVWLVLALCFSNLQGHPFVSRPRWTGPLIVSGAIFWWTLFLTNPWHHWLITPQPGEGSEFNALFPFYVGWLFAHPVAGSYVYLRLARRVRSTSMRVRVAALAVVGPVLIVGASLPFVSETGTLLDDAGDLALTVALLMAMAGIYGTRLFALSPVGLHRAVEHQADGIVLLDVEGLVLYANAAAERLFAPSKIVLDTPIYPMLSSRLELPEPNAPPLTPETLRVHLEGETASGAGRLFRAGESWYRITVTPIPGIFGRTRAKSLAVSDHTTLHRAIERIRERESALRASEERYRVLFQESPLGVIVLDTALEIVSANQTLARLVGAESPDALAGLSIAEIPVLDEVECQEILSGAHDFWSPLARNRSWVSRSGQQVHTRIHLAALRGLEGRVIGLQAIVEDEGERHRLQDELNAARKLEALGQLAGGVAHDFNNNLTVILGNAELLDSDRGDGHEWRARVREVTRAAERSAALTRQLLAFGRKQHFQLRVVELGALVRGLHGMLEPLLGEQITLEVELSDEALCSKLDPSQLETVLINLAVNARDAMGDGGTLTVRMSGVDLKGEVAQLSPDARPGSYVMVEFRDDGVGMDGATKERMFDPFFTTKDVGRGTGLGLATVYGIVKQSDGFVTVKSELGDGTTVRVHLPRVDASLLTEHTETERLPPRGSGTILLVEDESRLRSLAAAVLKAHGYTVLEATDGRDALDRARAHKDAIDLLVTDVIMPRLGGVELVERLREERADLRVLYISGYADGSIDEDRLNDAGVSFLPKPFTPRQLVKRVQEQLQARYHAARA